MAHVWLVLTLAHNSHVSSSGYTCTCTAGSLANLLEQKPFFPQERPEIYLTLSGRFHALVMGYLNSRFPTDADEHNSKQQAAGVKVICLRQRRNLISVCSLLSRRLSFLALSLDLSVRPSSAPDGKILGGTHILPFL
jgi:hypothetical protein